MKENCNSNIGSIDNKDNIAYISTDIIYRIHNKSEQNIQGFLCYNKDGMKMNFLLPIEYFEIDLLDIYSIYYLSDDMKTFCISGDYETFVIDKVVDKNKIYLNLSDNERKVFDILNDIELHSCANIPYPILYFYYNEKRMYIYRQKSKLF